jgi:hypothetical protein
MLYRLSRMSRLSRSTLCMYTLEMGKLLGHVSTFAFEKGLVFRGFWTFFVSPTSGQ